MDRNSNPNEDSEDKRKETTLPRAHYTLDDLLAQITPENLHGESDFGEPHGREVW